MDFVRIQHPDIEGTGECTAEAFALVYEAKGWQIVPDDQPAPVADPAAAGTENPPTTTQES